MKTSRQQRLLIEQYAILTENAPEIGGKLDLWHNFYQPSTPAECELLDMAVMASVQFRRVSACLTETVNQEVRTAVFNYDCDREDEVDYYRRMLETAPGAAVVGLKRSALGCRFLIGRLERLLGLIDEEGTLYGNDRDELIHYQGAKATNPENLFQSEGAYLTWLYCLMAQREPKTEHIVALGNERFMPTALMDRKAEHFLGEAELCQQLLRERIERELASVRPREELLRKNFETPARDGAEVRKQVLQGPVGARLLREMQSHDYQFHRAYAAFLKGRDRTVKTGMLPAQAIVNVHGDGDDSTTTAQPVPLAESMSVEQGVALRKQAAEVLAPGTANGIGAPIARGDIERAAVMATGPLSPDELRAVGR